MKIRVFPEISTEDWIEKFRFTELKTLCRALMMAAWCAHTGSYQLYAPSCDDRFKEHTIWVTQGQYDNFWKPMMECLGEWPNEKV